MFWKVFIDKIIIKAALIFRNFVKKYFFSEADMITCTKRLDYF